MFFFIMRDNDWLSEKMYYLWENFFVDVPRKNIVVIKFGKKSYRQLGAIKWAQYSLAKLKKLFPQSELDMDSEKRVSQINITSYFKDEFIPEKIVLATIAHEMCHYAHGFNSPLQQLYSHPHKGGVIRKEMASRGLGEFYKTANHWLKLNWSKYIRSQKAK